MKVRVVKSFEGWAFGRWVGLYAEEGRVNDLLDVMKVNDALAVSFDNFFKEEKLGDKFIHVLRYSEYRDVKHLFYLTERNEFMKKYKHLFKVITRDEFEEKYEVINSSYIEDYNIVITEEVIKEMMKLFEKFKKNYELFEVESIEDTEIVAMRKIKEYKEIIKKKNERIKELEDKVKKLEEKVNEYRKKANLYDNVVEKMQNSKYTKALHVLNYIKKIESEI